MYLTNEPTVMVHGKKDRRLFTLVNHSSLVFHAGILIYIYYAGVIID